jgi:hypothetical protein
VCIETYREDASDERHGTQGNGVANEARAHLGLSPQQADGNQREADRHQVEEGILQFTDVSEKSRMKTLAKYDIPK